MRVAAGPIAEMRNVSKSYGAHQAVGNLGLTIRSGEFVALLGPNGAGKTTAISLFLGTRSPDAGTVRILGRDPRIPAARERIGATLQESDFPKTLKVTEVLDFVRAHFRAPQPVDDLVDSFMLQDLAQRQVGGLSGGETRRLALACAFAGNPAIVFLDEPTGGLDATSRTNLWRLFQGFVDRGGTILLTTHYLEEAEALASRVVVINRGHVIAEGSVDFLRREVALTSVRFRASTMPSLPQAARVEHRDGVYTVWTADADSLVKELVRAEVPFSQLEVAPARLEDAFINLTRDPA